MPTTPQGWLIITMPDDPPAPASIEFSVIDIVAESTSPFTGQQQVQDWQASFMEASFSLPPLTDEQAQPWVQFMRDMKGVANVTQFTPAFAGAYASSIGDRYWRLKTNLRKWSVSKDRFYGMQIEFREAI